MFAIIHLLATFIADLFKSRRRLEVENLFLRHQLNIALRRAPQRVRLGAGDRCPRKSYPHIAMVQSERIGVVMIAPHLWIARRNGASFSNAKCVRDSL
jgi:hypothetical protein